MSSACTVVLHWQSSGLDVVMQKVAQVRNCHDHNAGNDGIGKMWLTDVTLQGDGDGVRDCDACGLSNWARVYAEGTSSTCMTHMHSDAYLLASLFFSLRWCAKSSATAVSQGRKWVCRL